MSGEEGIELFVPGRVCLFGEHSDWAGSFRRFNKSLCKGYTLVVGTNQGLYARVRKHPSELVLCSTDNDGNKLRKRLSMEPESLLQVAREGGFWSYVAGVAYRIATDYHVEGLEIDNYKTTLPLKKGLSSSAAICVMTSRAFNRMYDLRLTVRGEMEYAYSGEILTPSMCGRLDQACAFGSVPVLMAYDGEFTGVEKIQIARKLHMVIVDLCAKKDTVEILTKLQLAFPHAQNEMHRGVQRCLGELNQEIVQEAVKLMTQESDGREESENEILERLGMLMKRAQANFDLYGGAICPSQLTAPVLHKCLAHESLQKHIFGGKGIGAGGDGSAQLLCKSESDQEKAMEIVRKELGMQALKLTIEPVSTVVSAIIPAAGFAAGLFPASKACKAELFPIVDRNGTCRPLIMNIIDEMIQAGIERVCVIVQEADYEQFRRLFNDRIPAHNAKHLDEKGQALAKHVEKLGRHIDLVIQKEQQGFGHAVFCARDRIGANKPFLLALGHYAYRSTRTDDCSCVQQLLNVHRKLGTSVVGLKRTPLAQVGRFGTVAGTTKSMDDMEGRKLVHISKVCEKPTVEYARSNLQIQGQGSSDLVGNDECLTLFGMYILAPDIFQFLEQDIQENNREERGLIGLTPALDKLRKFRGLYGHLVEGERFPVSDPACYIRAINQFSS